MNSLEIENSERQIMQQKGMRNDQYMEYFHKVMDEGADDDDDIKLIMLQLV